MLTITHTHAEGTLIEGTSKGDGAGQVLKAHGWRWGRSIGAWYVPHSRDRAPKTATIEATAGALKAAGWTVAQQIDRAARSTAEIEADKIARAQDRAAGLAAKAERRTEAAEAAYERHLRDMAALPEGGEPVKVGHHSETRHRRDLARADASMRRQIEATEEAREAQDRAQAASQATARRYAPVTVANRIETIRAEIRKHQRTLEGYTRTIGGHRETFPPASGGHRQRLLETLADLQDQADYWQQVRAAQIAEGTATNYGPEMVSKGDAVKISGQWVRVARANAKSVSVEILIRPETGYTVTHRAPWAHVQDHRQQ